MEGAEFVGGSAGIIVLDHSLCCVDHDDQVATLIGLDPTHLAGAGWLLAIDPAHREGVWVELLRSVTGTTTTETWIPLSGSTRRLHLRAEPVSTGDSHVLVCTLEDPRRRTGHDPATPARSQPGLVHPDAVVEAIDRAVTDGTAASLAVIHVEVLGLDVVAVTDGPQVAEVTRLALTRRVPDLARPGDLVARAGADSFVILSQVDETVDAVVIAERATSALSAPLRVDGHEVSVNAVAGIAVLEPGMATHLPEVSSGTALLREARNGAIDAQRRPHCGTLAIRERDQILDRLSGSFSVDDIVTVDSLAAGLTRALEHDEIEVRYVPEASTTTLNVEGFKAEAWWDHPDLGLVDLLSGMSPLLDDTVSRIRVERWLLTQAITACGRWTADIRGRAPLTISVPCSAESVLDDEFLHDALHAAAMSAISPAQVTLEIPEVDLVEPTGRLAAKLEALAGAGFRLAVARFRGVLPVSRFQALPISIAVVNRTSFVAADRLTATDDPSRGEAMQQAVMRAASSLGLDVIADEVDGPVQARQILELDCTRIRGRQVGPALDAAGAYQLLTPRVG